MKRKVRKSARCLEGAMIATSVLFLINLAGDDIYTMSTVNILENIVIGLTALALGIILHIAIDEVEEEQKEITHDF